VRTDGAGLTVDADGLRVQVALLVPEDADATLSAAYVIPAQSGRRLPEGRALSMTLTSIPESAAPVHASASGASGMKNGDWRRT
jgi:hypothetical protein